MHQVAGGAPCLPRRSHGSALRPALLAIVTASLLCLGLLAGCSLLQHADRIVSQRSARPGARAMPCRTSA